MKEVIVAVACMVLLASCNIDKRHRQVEFDAITFNGLKATGVIYCDGKVDTASSIRFIKANYHCVLDTSTISIHRYYVISDNEYNNRANVNYCN